MAGMKEVTAPSCRENARRMACVVERDFGAEARRAVGEAWIPAAAHDEGRLGDAMAMLRALYAALGIASARFETAITSRLNAGAIPGASSSGWGGAT